MVTFRTTIFYFFLTFLVCAARVWGGTVIERRIPLAFDGSGSAGGPYCIAPGSNNILFVLDRGRAVLYRFSAETGTVVWHTDGSESGDRFIDPAYISSPDGFFLYLTDRGARLVRRVDYRGEIRGSLDLPFAADPVLCELVAGRQMVVYDRAEGAIHLLNDSGQPLWSFPAGGGRRTAEPKDICVSLDGLKLYILWPESLEITAVDIFGRTSSTFRLQAERFQGDHLAAISGAGGEEFLCLTGSGKSLILFEPLTGKTRKIAIDFGMIWDLGAVPDSPGVLCLLVGPEPALVEIKLEPGD